jgi:hypothetical protein
MQELDCNPEQLLTNEAYDTNLFVAISKSAVTNIKTSA